MSFHLSSAWALQEFAFSIPLPSTNGTVLTGTHMSPLLITLCTRLEGRHDKCYPSVYCSGCGVYTDGGVGKELWELRTLALACSWIARGLESVWHTVTVPVTPSIASLCHEWRASENRPETLSEGSQSNHTSLCSLQGFCTPSVP